MGVVGAQIVFDEPLCRRRLGERDRPARHREQGQRADDPCLHFCFKLSHAARVGRGRFRRKIVAGWGSHPAGGAFPVPEHCAHALELWTVRNRTASSVGNGIPNL